MRDARRGPGVGRGRALALLLFAIRHTLGVGIFVWLTFEARRLIDGDGWLVVALLGLAYLVFAVVAGTRLLALYRRRAHGERPWK